MPSFIYIRNIKFLTTHCYFDEVQVNSIVNAPYNIKMKSHEQPTSDIKHRRRNIATS